jgi:glycosyltransferase involved in cell wall biosynthesis
MLDAQIAREGLADRVTFVGGVDEARLDAYYEKADLFVMASLFEGYGMVLAEAMVRGLPILTTTGGAASQTVPDGAGLKVPPGDADALRLALARLIDDAALRLTLADAAYAASRSLPTWADTARIIAAATHNTLSR